MKKLVVLSTWVTVVCLSQQTHADQTSGWTDMTIVGVTIGVDLATQGGSWLNDQSFDRRVPKLGIAAGGILSVRVNRFFSAQTEIGFVAKGIRWDTGNPGSSSTSDADYLEIPMLARVSLPVSRRVEPYAYLGPAFAILMDADTSFDDGRFDESDRNVATFDVGLMFGVGAAVDVSRDIGTIAFDIRCNLGLRNVNVAVDDPSDEVLNRAIYLTVGYRADLATLRRLFGRSPRGPAEPASAEPATTSR
jgi:hypothetical protein